MPLTGVRYRVTTTKHGKRVRLAFRGKRRVVEAKNLDTGATHTPEEFAADRRRMAKADEELAHPDWTTPAGDVRRTRRYRLTRGGRIVKAKGEQLGLFGGMGEPRKPVKEPGKRGGKWYTTDRGDIRYGQKPAPTAEAAPAALAAPVASQGQAEEVEHHAKSHFSIRRVPGDTMHVTMHPVSDEGRNFMATMGMAPGQRMRTQNAIDAEKFFLQKRTWDQNAWRPRPELVASFPAGEGSEWRVYDHRNGKHAAVLLDLDAREVASTTIFSGPDSRERATEHARANAEESRRRTSPVAPEPPATPEVEALPPELPPSTPSTQAGATEESEPDARSKRLRGLSILGLTNGQAVAIRYGTKPTAFVAGKPTVARGGGTVATTAHIRLPDGTVLNGVVELDEQGYDHRGTGIFMPTGGIVFQGADKDFEARIKQAFGVEAVFPYRYKPLGKYTRHGFDDHHIGADGWSER